MNKRLLNTTLGIALGLSFAAVPGYCAPVTLQFSGASQGSDTVVVNIPNGVQGSTDTLNQFSAIFSKVIIGTTGANNGQWNLTAGSLTWSSIANTFSLSATVGTCSLGCTGSALVGDTVIITATMLFPYNTSTSLEDFYETGSGSSEQATVDFGTTASLAVSGTLAGALGAPNGAILTSGGGILTTQGPTASGTGTSEIDTYNSQSPILDATFTSTSTPEPASFFLLAGGLLGMGWRARRKRSAKA